jgi:hypothetical protein
MIESRALNENWDIYFDKARSAFVENSQAVAQHVKARLWAFLGEWFLDETAGTPWFQSVFIKPVDMVQVEFILKERILETTGVKELVTFNLTFSNRETLEDKKRTLRLDFSYVDIYDVTVEESIDA